MISAASTVVDQKVGPLRVARELGIPYTTLRDWVIRYRAGGAGALGKAQVVNFGANSAKARQLAARMCAIGAQLAKPYNQLVGKIPKGFQAHHIFQDAKLLGAASNYSRYTALAIPLLGGSIMPGSPHDLANRFQSMNDAGTRQSFQRARSIAYGALLAAGCRAADATEMILAAENNFKLRGVGLGF
jgi:hypothetical protein